MFNSRKVYKSILIIPDTHIPAEHKDMIAFLTAVKEKYQPDAVVHIGDIVDMHAVNYHEHDPDLPSAGDEIKKVRDKLQTFYKLFPDMFCIFGNHCKLIHRKATTAGIPKIAVRELSEILNAPLTWKWSSCLKLATCRGSIYFTHGKTSSINKLALMTGMSSVQGHYHSKFYCSYIATPEKLFFDMNVGCLIDKDHAAFLYGEQCIGKPMLGCGIIKEGRGILVPMLLSPGGRWSRKL